jgi:hypothetical protein
MYGFMSHIYKLAVILPKIEKNEKMKKKFILINLFIAIIFYSCSAPMKYQNNMFNNTFFENKTIYFLLTEKSDEIRIVKEGPNRGETKTPNNREVYKKSIEDLAIETKLNLKYVESGKDLTKDEIIINVNIKNLNWIFGFSSATMKSLVNYEVAKNKKSYEIIGIHKNSTGGSKEWNLYNSLKNANYQFLKELENN